ncbi:MAG: asparagine synthase-related protein, partial [Pseudolabrys sp.]
VRMRMIADVPLGAFLSGGVDSSGVVALMAGLKAGPVSTFSIAFGAKGWDESEPRRVCRRLSGLSHAAMAGRSRIA